MALAADFRNRLLDGGGVGEAVTASLHTSTAEPTAGSDEVTGGSYARQAITWAAASSGSVSVAQEIAFNVPAGTTVRWVGLWDASSTWLGALKTSTDEVFESAGVARVDPATINLTNQP
ncbi:hypothetical protein [Nocardiopsis sp. FIRDI 009]|uniref:phage tail fiber protein n=1 Tax=Nocardiopsis sp. FIRDI 009 TaxID=714197 RepID=UPI000E25241E|nr:hypothetical protein [Nocardiopsis sp. FIRDI 009]